MTLVPLQSATGEYILSDFF